MIFVKINVSFVSRAAIRHSYRVIATSDIIFVLDGLFDGSAANECLSISCDQHWIIVVASSSRSLGSCVSR